AVNEACGVETGDVICFQIGKPSIVNAALSKLRIDVGKKMGLIPEYGHGGEWKFLWVVNPPLFEEGEDGTWAPA
ncbi:MAG: aspartate--tRNA ligase, partial [Myxococcales bacterium]|nr:aspartate--tRNA ligase [Myxococcales bacterium]